MALFDPVRPTTYGNGFGSRLTAVIHAAFTKFAAWNDARSTRMALNKLSDRELDDIGLSRGDIDQISG